MYVAIQAVDKVVVAMLDIVAILEEFGVDTNEIVVQSKELIKDANKISQVSYYIVKQWHGPVM